MWFKTTKKAVCIVYYHYCVASFSLDTTEHYSSPLYFTSESHTVIFASTVSTTLPKSRASYSNAIKWPFPTLSVLCSNSVSWGHWSSDCRAFMVVSCCSVQQEEGGSSDKRRNSRLIKPFETKNHTTVIYNSLYQLTRLIFICHITQIPYLPLWVKSLFVLNITWTREGKIIE